MIIAINPVNRGSKETDFYDSLRERRSNASQTDGWCLMIPVQMRHFGETIESQKIPQTSASKGFV